MPVRLMLNRDEAAAVKKDLLDFIHKTTTNSNAARPEELAALPEIVKTICIGIAVDK